MKPSIFIGIDVSKRKLDVYIRPLNELCCYPNSNAGWQQIVKKFLLSKPALIVLEATGGYEQAIVRALRGASLPAVIVNPLRVRRFAQAHGTLGKTDALDAKILALYAEAFQDHLAPKKVVVDEELKGLNLRRRQLQGMIVQEKNRARLASKKVLKSLDRHLKHLEKELARIEAAIKKHVDSKPELAKKRDLLKSAPGVGPVVAHTMLAQLPELGTLTGKEIASLVGVAPWNRDSGLQKGQRRIWGGRKAVRSTLYMAALVGTQSNDDLKGFYQRLLTRGKEKKVALVACMRKLLLALNAMLRENKPWCPKQLANQA